MVLKKKIFDLMLFFGAIASFFLLYYGTTVVSGDDGLFYVNLSGVVLAIVLVLYATFVLKNPSGKT